MSQPADETRLGELLVTTGKLSSEELLAALEAQRQLGGPKTKRLGEILVERGHLSEEDLQATLNLPSPSPETRETWPAKPTPGDSAEDVSEEIRQALADPSRCIGRYAKVSELGRGGMGVVHRCYDPQLHRSVAVKMILEAGEASDEGLARFKREARAAAKLQHPGIVALHEVGEHQGSPYLVMDFVEGHSFEALLKSEKPTARRIVEIVQEVALALHHAHEAGIIHRDVKPHNVMVDPQGKAHVMDFGLARDSSARQQLTQTGQIMGTPAFMAPEQADADLGAHGPWTDVYALGAVLYRALTGRPVFQATSPAAMLKKILMDEPKPLRRLDSTISADLETIALKCLEKEPNRRYPSAAAVAEELGRFLEGQAILARPLSQSERAMRWTRRNRALSAALAVVAMVVVGATVVVVRQAATARQEREEAIRREERAKIQTEQEATSKEQERASRQDLATLRREVTAVLDRVRSGEVLENPTDAELEKAKILKHRQALAVKLINDELNDLSKLLAETQELSHGKELLLEFLCEALWNLGIQEDAVAALGQYLETELALPAAKRNQLRAVPAGKALCLLGGEGADRLLLAASNGFGLNGAFWGQVSPLYGRTGIEPGLKDETARGFNNRGNARRAKGDFEGAIADFTRAIEIDPNYAVAWNNRGNVRNDKGDLDGAIADYSRAIDIDPNLAGAWTNRGLARKLKGHLDDAIADYSRAIELDPDLVEAWTNRGLARSNKGDLDGAIADFTRAIEIDPNYASAWSNRGDVRKDKGDLDGAIADHTRAIEIDPNYTPAWGNRGIAQQAKGDLDGAITDFTRAIEIDPNYAVAWYNRGIVRKAKGDLDGAIADFTRAIKLDPNLAMAWGVRGNIRRAQGDLDGAIADHTRAIKLDPNLAAAWRHRGIARQAKGDLDGAIADWQRLLELAPNHPHAPAIRAEIQKMLAQQRAKAGAESGK